VVQVGLQTQPVTLNLLPLTFGDIILRGSICYPCDSWPKVMNVIASGVFPLERIVTGIVPLEEAITQGFDRLLDPQGTELKVVLDVSGPA
jgi:(R,R)-butanediol dehydrogenase / meso-butanediol dehydrogenase / diacetyl reductase